MALIRPTVWTQQPQQAVKIDPSSGFKYAWTASSAGDKVTYNGSTPVVFGGVLAFNLAYTNPQELLPDDSGLATQGGTFVFCGKSLTTNASGEFGTQPTVANDASRAGAHVPYTDGTVYFDFGGVTSGTTRLSVAGLTFSNNDVFVFTTGSRGMEIWQNGVLRASNASNPTRSTGRVPWGIGSNGNAGVVARNTCVKLMAYAPKQITTAEIKSISNNPWQIFKPIPRRIFVPVAATGDATGSGSLSAISLSALTGTATGTANATASGSLSNVSLAAPSGSASVSVTASGSVSTITLGTVEGTATGTEAGNAVGTGSIQPITISAPDAIAIASSVATGGIQSIGLTAPTGTAAGQLATVARPGSDASNAGWIPSTGSDLFAMLDEATPDDADFISTSSVGSVCNLGLGAVADPGTSSGQVVSYRASSSTGNGLMVELMQGASVIATWTHESLSATDTTYSQSLSAAECDAITDYTALSVRLTSL